MKNVAIVYWSGTGNTEEMAQAVLEGAKQKGATASLYEASEFDASMAKTFDSFAFGCPSMGAEQLEESEFEPMFEACLPELNGKEVGLFGSYGWGDGEWMRDWEERCTENGVRVTCDPVICNETPDEDALEECRQLGSDISA